MLTIEQARLCVTGWDHNRPANFPGLGDFIGWARGIERAPNGDLLLVHSAGYWHVSFARPRLFHQGTRKKWEAEGWPLDYDAPTGGRSMMTRSQDEGKTWSQPKPITDFPLDDSPVTLFVCPDETILCFINVQASWYGFSQAPETFNNDLEGLNTRQCVIRSTDNGETWSQPIWFDSPGTFYQRSHAQAIQLPDGGILWPTYCADQGKKQLFGAVHRSDDSGLAWRTISTIRRPEQDVDEPAVARFKDKLLVMVSRPDGGIFLSNDDGVSWNGSGKIVESGVLKAPRLVVLPDQTLACIATYQGHLHLFLSRADSELASNWTHPMPVDASCYGYPGGRLMEDGSLLIPYCESGRAPNRVYLVRLRINTSRDGFEFVPISSDG
ncbi:hypothetical protein CMK14_11825 [Candidatus Poribacteria bacterium]|nr:hypothetical protein [Candidatus Poribacteria bacterium]